MIDATLNLTRMHCNVESDFAGAEPYLWTLFFYLDMTTISGSTGLVATHTPHQTSTTRGMYPNGIHAGDNVTIPLSMGEFDVTLDGGNLGLSQLGCLFVLIDERNTDADAIKAGHVAFGDSAHEALNELAAAKVLADDKTPTPEETTAMAKHIGTAVKNAIKNKLDWWDALDQQDRLVGSGFKVYSDAEISEIASNGGGVSQFVVKIREERTFEQNTLVDDYDVVGALRVRQADPIIDPSGCEGDRFVEAVRVLKAVQTRIVALEEEVSQARGDAREALLADLRHTRRITLKRALRVMGSARRVYDLARPKAVEQDVSHHGPASCFERSQWVYSDCVLNGGNKQWCGDYARWFLWWCEHPDSLRGPMYPNLPAKM